MKIYNSSYFFVLHVFKIKDMHKQKDPSKSVENTLKPCNQSTNIATKIKCMLDVSDADLLRQILLHNKKVSGFHTES